MINKDSLLNQVREFSKEYDTDNFFKTVDKDLENIDKVLATLVYSRLDGSKEISLVTVPTKEIRYIFKKR